MTGLVVNIGSLRHSSTADEPAKAKKQPEHYWTKVARKYLSAMKEPPLDRLAERDRASTIYRFLWLPFGGITMDGHMLIIEGVKDGKYQVVRRDNPPGGDFVDLCQAMLFISGIDVRRLWFEYRQ
jgi:hypothetical protein